MAVVSIQYTEFGKKNLNYKSVSISLRNGKEKKFNSGDFVKDWYDCNKFIITSDINEPISNPSSVDHFIMDGAPYDSAYLNAEEEVCILEYEYDYNNPKIEFFVKKNTKPTWEELRALCGDAKKHS